METVFIRELTSIGFQQLMQQGNLHVQQVKESTFDDILSVSELNEYLSRRDLQYPYVRLVKSGKEIPVESYLAPLPSPYSLIDNDKFFSKFAEGTAIVIYYADYAFEGLHHVSRQLEELIGYPVSPTIFISHTDTVATVPHYDLKDSLVLQLYGNKYWPIYPNPIIKDPTDEQPSLLDYGPVFEAEGIEQEIKLEAGDWMYFPRGTVHRPYTKDQISIHIAFVIESLTYYDLFKDIATHAKDTAAFRQFIPHLNQDNSQEVDNRIRSLFETYNFESTVQKANTWDKSIRNFRNRFLDILKLNDQQLHSQSELSLRKHIGVKIIQQEEAVRISFLAKQLDFPIAVTPALEFIQQQKATFTPDMLPEIQDSDMALSLCYELLLEGLLVMH